MDPDLVDADREAARAFFEAHPLLYFGTRQPGTLEAWLRDMELSFHLCHIEGRLQVALASRCLADNARMWWLRYGEHALPRRTWADFRALMLQHFGPLPEAGPSQPYRDPEIYRDMEYARYLSFSALWHSYPQETMGHYCRRFQEAMMPLIPHDLDSADLQTLTLLRNGLPPHIRRFVVEPTRGMTVVHMIEIILRAEITAQTMPADAVGEDHQATAADTSMAEPEPVYEPEPVDDAGMAEPFYEPGPVFLEDPIPAIPLQEIPPLEAAAEVGVDEHEIEDFIVAPEDQPDDPPVIDISSDEEEADDDPPVIDLSSDEEEPEPEPEEEDPEPQADWLEEADDFLDDPEEIPLGNEDDEDDSDAPSMITDEDID